MAILSEVCRYRHAGGLGWLCRLHARVFSPSQKMQQAIPQTGLLRVKFATKGDCYSTFHFLTTE
ncbi:hypothetical protein PBP221_08640 [Paraburkholderia sp. 22B1P]|nr:hypothetical protein PBP221_08640 [Paraburkholderia sp. 22B1P]